jgi:hypothetical protein
VNAAPIRGSLGGSFVELCAKAGHDRVIFSGPAVQARLIS